MKKNRLKKTISVILLYIVRLYLLTMLAIRRNYHKNNRESIYFDKILENMQRFQTKSNSYSIVKLKLSIVKLKYS